MPALFFFEGPILILRFTGDSPPDIVPVTLDAALAGADRPLPRGLLIDARQSASVLRRSAAEVRSAGSEIVRRAEAIGNRVAFVAASDALYELFQTLAAQLQAAGIASAVFREEWRAAAWLRATILARGEGMSG